jgi:hypothetical protein
MDGEAVTVPSMQGWPRGIIRQGEKIMNYSKFYTKKLGALVGGRITGTVTDGPEGDGFYGLRIVHDGKIMILWILRDDEGNGPGSFELQEVKPGEAS